MWELVNGETRREMIAGKKVHRTKTSDRKKGKERNRRYKI